LSPSSCFQWGASILSNYNKTVEEFKLDLGNEKGTGTFWMEEWNDGILEKWKNGMMQKSSYELQKKPC